MLKISNDYELAEYIEYLIIKENFLTCLYVRVIKIPPYGSFYYPAIGGIFLSSVFPDLFTYI